MFSRLREATCRPSNISAWSPIRFTAVVHEVGAIALTIIGGVGFKHEWPIGVSAGLLAAGLSSFIIGEVIDFVDTRMQMTAELQNDLILLEALRPTERTNCGIDSVIIEQSE